MKRDDTKKNFTSLSGNDLQTVRLHYPSFPCIIAIVPVSRLLNLMRYSSVLNANIRFFCSENRNFQRKRKTFNIPLLIIGSEFQQKVWKALQSVPYGETRSYSWQAAWIGNSKAVRAVGTANGANPISIFLPCHRIIGNKQQLTGYGGGLEVKRFLLKLESPLLI